MLPTFFFVAVFLLNVRALPSSSISERKFDKLQTRQFPGLEEVQVVNSTISKPDVAPATQPQNPGVEVASPVDAKKEGESEVAAGLGTGKNNDNEDEKEVLGAEGNDSDDDDSETQDEDEDEEGSEEDGQDGEITVLPGEGPSEMRCDNGPTMKTMCGDGHFCLITSMARKRDPVPQRRGGGIDGWGKCVKNGTSGLMCPKDHKGDAEHDRC